MKKRLIILLSLLALLAVAGSASAQTVGACPAISYDETAGNKIWVTVRCTAGTGGAITDVTLADEVMEKMDGGYIYRIFTLFNGAVVFDDNSDLQIVDEVGFIPIAPAGNGANVIDAATFNEFMTEDNSNNDWYYGPISQENSLTLTITNNTQVGGVVDITFIVDKN